jgi:hypothetical protein
MKAAVDTGREEMKARMDIFEEKLDKTGAAARPVKKRRRPG